MRQQSFNNNATISSNIIDDLHKAGIGTEVVKTVGKEKVLSENLVSAHREQPSVTENKVVHYGNEAINLNDLRKAAKINLMGDAGVNGESLNNLKESKEWKRSGEHGRATTIGDISVERLKDEQGKVLLPADSTRLEQ